MSIYPNNPLMAGQVMYNPYIPQPNYFNFQQPQVQAVQGPHMEIQSVNGRDAIFSFPMGPNSSAILADKTEPKIWMVTTDSAGYKAVKGFKIVPDEEEKPEVVVKTQDDQIADLSDRISKLEERMNRYGQSNSRSGYAGKPNSSVNQQNVRNGENSRESDASVQPDGGK